SQFSAKPFSPLFLEFFKHTSAIRLSINHSAPLNGWWGCQVAPQSEPRRIFVLKVPMHGSKNTLSKTQCVHPRQGLRPNIALNPS
ncbi:MAG: hypothetical protein ACTHLW_08010, partial [Verrucomicrobiota bacterium]